MIKHQKSGPAGNSAEETIILDLDTDTGPQAMAAIAEEFAAAQRSRALAPERVDYGARLDAILQSEDRAIAPSDFGQVHFDRVKDTVRIEVGELDEVIRASEHGSVASFVVENGKLRSARVHESSDLPDEHEAALCAVLDSVISNLAVR
jgi:hypothetical protein